jgi:hypothetical protein
LASRGTGRSAPTDPDAQTPGHLPEEMPETFDEQAMVPGRWYGGEEPEGYDRERVGDPLGMDQVHDVDETDDRMMDDDEGPGMPDPDEPDDLDIADHLRGDEEKTSLGDPPDETMETEVWLKAAIDSYMLQENPAGAGMVDPTVVRGAYSDFDMNSDHMGTDDLSATWYRSPGREPGGDGDPFRGPDPHAQLGFHPPKAQSDPTASPPGADGEEGVASRLAPPIWQLSAGSDTSKVLGANAKADTGGVESGDEPEEGAEGEEGQGGEEGGEAEGQEPR